MNPAPIEERRRNVPLLMVAMLLGAGLVASFVAVLLERSTTARVAVMIGAPTVVFVVLVTLAKTRPSDGSPFARLYRWLFTEPGPYRYPKPDGTEERPIGP